LIYVLFNLLCLAAFHWAELWRGLIALTRFVMAHYDEISDSAAANEVLDDAVRLLNMGIVYGEDFLADPPSYDNLFYELIRSAEVFELLASRGTNRKILGSCEIIII
jgi:hypothetical protein